MTRIRLVTGRNSPDIALLGALTATATVFTVGMKLARRHTPAQWWARQSVGDRRNRATTTLIVDAGTARAA
jgi:hypothetical protein